MPNCETCKLTAKRDAGEAPFWDNIHRTLYWDVVHHNRTTLPGWLVLVVHRHITALDELSEAEADELGPLIRQTSAALKEVVGCAKTYVIQFAEHPQHPHVHFHIIPRMPDMPADRRGDKVFGCVAETEADRVSEAVMNDIAAKVKAFLTPLAS